jgi:hypothetical protein
VVLSFVDFVEQADDHERRGGQNRVSGTIPSEALLHHYLGRERSPEDEQVRFLLPIRLRT